MKRIVLAVAATLIVSLFGVQPHAEAATRAQIKEAAERYSFSLSLREFIAVKAKKPYDATLVWEDNGCSAPFMKTGIDFMFRQACQRHDFGYRNFGHGPTFGSNATTKKRIDDKLLSDMRWICLHRFAGQSGCYATAQIVYTSIRTSGKSETAFYDGKCTTNRLCLFDDHDYQDRRIVLSVSENNMNDVDFGDKTSSLINKTAVSWVVYDDHDYKDRAFCIKPGVSVKNFDASALRFGDKTSSAKRLSSAACPSGVPVIK